MENQNQKLYISVVVTAYNRKQFLPYALNSIQNQILSKDEFEVILVTNFTYDLDNYSDLNIKHIVMEGSLGEFLYAGIREAKGRIISFLDDDDTFFKDKLLNVFNVFHSYDIGLYIDKNISVIKPCIEENSDMIIKYPYKVKKEYYRRIFSNLSTKSMKKELLICYMNDIRQLKTSPDSMISLICMLNKSNIMLGNFTGTFYRRHDKNTSILNKNNPEEYIRWIKDLERPEMEKRVLIARKNSLYYISNLFTGNLVYIQGRLLTLKAITPIEYFYNLSNIIKINPKVLLWARTYRAIAVHLGERITNIRFN